MTPHFHPLTIREIRREIQRENAGAVSLAFDVPSELRAAYTFTQGQFLTLRATVGGQDLRRSYSICSGVDEYLRCGELRVAIKAVGGGIFSNYVNQELKAGATLQVMTPDGRFFTPLDAAARKHYVAFAAGSGITPIMSLVKTTLGFEPNSRFTLIYGNQTVDTILFCEELEDLKNRYMSRFALHHVLSRADSDIELANGRIDAAKCAAFLRLLPPNSIDEAFVCGPSGMIDTVEASLIAAGVPARHVHAERFGVPGVAPTSQPTESADAGNPVAVNVVLDGKRYGLKLPRKGRNILDAALTAGLDLPYSCRSGVCCTCRAKLLEGQVTMEKNYTLEPWELAQGFILTCQAHPASDQVVLSFDER